MKKMLSSNNNKKLSFIIIGLLGLVLCSCSMYEINSPDLNQLDTLDPASILEKEKQAQSLGPPPFSEKFEPAIKDFSEDSKLYSFVFDNTPLSEVLKAIIYDSGFNMSIESGVDLTRPITINLKQVTFKEALNMVVNNGASLAWDIKNNTIHIRRFEEKIYQFDYIDVLGEVSIKAGGDMLGASAEGTGVSGQFEIKGSRSEENTDIWASIADTLTSMKSDEGLIKVNRMTGVIYLKDTPSRIRSMTRFLDVLSESVHRQVFIEAKIFEVVLSENNKMGVDWTKLAIELDSDLLDTMSLNFLGGSTISIFDEEIDEKGVPQRPHRDAVKGVVDFLKTQGDLSVLSNPHLSLMNGQSAVLTVGYQFPYGDIKGVTRDDETNDVYIDSEITRTILGLQLGITAQISEDRNITLNVIPTITKILDIEEVEVPTSGTSVQSISNPVIDLQEIATTVRVKDGHSVVLAGLISKSRVSNHTGLPFLGSIPLIKYLFKNMTEDMETRELVILITPYIKKQD